MAYTLYLYCNVHCWQPDDLYSHLGIRSGFAQLYAAALSCPNYYV